MIVLGINHFSDPAACILIDGELMAFAEEERFTRYKNSHNMFPGNSIAYCLKETGLSLDDVNKIAIPYNAHYYPFGFMKKMAMEFFSLTRKSGKHKTNIVQSSMKIAELAFQRTPSAMRQAVREGLLKHRLFGRIPQIDFVEHHLCHAICASYFSGYDSALVLLVDGSGESDCTTLYDFEKGHLTRLDTYEIPHSLGWFYAGITEYLGFVPYRNEGKVMGLAPYGKRNDHILAKLSKIIDWQGHRYSVSPEYLLAGKHTYGLHFSDKMVDLFGPPRQYFEMLSEYHKDLAWASQFALEESVKKIVNQAVKKYGKKNVCLAGGVAMNCKMNGAVLYDSLADNVSVFPAAGDAGTSLGAAIRASGTKKWNRMLEHTYYGPSYTPEEIKHVLDCAKVKYTRPDSITKKVASLLSMGSMVGWFQGRMEFGARALGNRSILANPLIPGIKDKINLYAKFREPWRPFCPSILDSQKERYIKKNIASPFMIVAQQLNDEFHELLSSVTHCDGSIRPQTVNADQNSLYHRLLIEFDKLTGHGILLNTSLNIRGEPLACSPYDALRTFFGCGLDAIALGPFLIKKS